MSRQDSLIHVNCRKELFRMIEQRAKQEGVTLSDYIREAVMIKMVMSGDAEATKFVAKRVGKRMTDILVSKITGVNIKRQVEAIAAG